MPDVTSTIEGYHHVCEALADASGSLAAATDQLKWRPKAARSRCLGQLHGDIGGPIAVRAVLREHDGELVDGRDQLVGQLAGLAGCDEVMGNVGNQFT